eukprot:m.149915 g.149915  ORF g.149915 m.149915 type:complete len:715 (+) comp30692_c0_seq1:174-2318(+)
MASPFKSPSSRKSSAGTKSRFNSTYTKIFEGVDPSKEAKSDEARVAVWEELFLLKVNTAFLRQCIQSTTEAELLERAQVINTVFRQCVLSIVSKNQIRAANALQTLGCLMQEVFAKKDFPNFGFDVVSVLVGYDDCEEQTTNLIQGLRHVLENQKSAAEMKSLALCILIVITTATPNINQNPFVEALMRNCVFDDLLKLLDDKTERERYGYDAILLLGLLLNYKKPDLAPLCEVASADNSTTYTSTTEGSWRKVVSRKVSRGTVEVSYLYEARRWNIYAERLEELSDDVTLNALGSVVSATFSDDTRSWTSVATQEIQTGMFSKLLSGLFADSPEPLPTLSESVRAAECGALLLALYETVKLNAGFMTVITHTTVLDQADDDNLHADSPVRPKAEVTEEPTNLLSTFLTFSSFLLHDKAHSSSAFAKVIWTILIRICEDGNANHFLHDEKVNVPVTLYYSAMRHRTSEIKSVKSGPLAASLLDLCVEFLISNLKKTLQGDLYELCLGVVYRMLCYQKQRQIRLVFEWKKLWAALIGLAGFITRQEKVLIGHCDIFKLSNLVVNIINIFVTYGDTFLPNPTSYDELYYEIIRVHHTFDSLYQMAKRHEVGDYAPEAAQKLTTDLMNIRAITNHFNPLINQWKQDEDLTTLTQEQVLKVVNDNYGTLTLKLQDELLVYDDYVEGPEDADFFNELVSAVMKAHRDVDFKVTAIPITH